MPTTTYCTVHGCLLGESTGGVRTEYAHDACGSVIATIDQTNTLLNSYRYSPYGGVTYKTGVQPDPAFTYVGTVGYRKTDRSHAEVYIRQRHLSTSESLWTSADPLALGSPSYTYCNDSPTSRVDPSGLQDVGDGDFAGSYTTRRWSTGPDKRKHPVFGYVATVDLPKCCFLTASRQDCYVIAYSGLDRPGAKPQDGHIQVVEAGASFSAVNWHPREAGPGWVAAMSPGYNYGGHDAAIYGTTDFPLGLTSYMVYFKAPNQIYFYLSFDPVGPGFVTHPDFASVAAVGCLVKTISAGFKDPKTHVSYTSYSRSAWIYPTILFTDRGNEAWTEADFGLQALPNVAVGMTVFSHLPVTSELTNKDCLPCKECTKKGFGWDKPKK